MNERSLERVKKKRNGGRCTKNFLVTIEREADFRINGKRAGEGSFTHLKGKKFTYTKKGKGPTGNKGSNSTRQSRLRWGMPQNQRIFMRGQTKKTHN